MKQVHIVPVTIQFWNARYVIDVETGTPKGPTEGIMLGLIITI